MFTDKKMSEVHIGCQAIAVYWVYLLSVTLDFEDRVFLNMNLSAT